MGITAYNPLSVRINSSDLLVSGFLFLIKALVYIPTVMNLNAVNITSHSKKLVTV